MTGKRLFARAVVLLALLISGLAHASAEWLVSQQRGDGAFSNASDLATPYQGTAEAVRALRQLGTPYNAASALYFIASEPYGGTEYLSRRIIGLAEAGQNVSTLMVQLLGQQNSDGGFGEFSGFDSTVLDSIWALDALVATGNLNIDAAARTVGFVLSRQSNTGSFSEIGNDPSVHLTALASINLQRYRTRYAVAGAINSASSYLLGAQRAQGGWGAAMDTALALLAVAPMTVDSTRYAAAVQELERSRLPDSSWSGDVYTTALALRALRAAVTNPPPPSPTVGAFSGQVIDGATALPLNAVRIELEARTATTAADGRFSIEDVEPGNYIMRLSSPGFGSVTRNASVAAGQRVNVGVVALQPLPTTGTISGVITASDTGAAVAGAEIVFNGVEHVRVQTDAQGTFAIAVLPGEFSIQVAAAGYRTIVGTGALAAGARLVFSPALTSQSQPQPVNGVVIRGLVVDERDAAVEGVQVRFPGLNISSLTGASGTFTMSTQAIGELQMELQAAGYEAVALRLTIAAPGTYDIGTLRLRRQVQGTTRVVGTVTDSATGAPIVGATVLAAGLNAVSDALGRFEIVGITQLSFSITFGAPGYLSSTGTVTLEGPTTVQAPARLVRPSIAGIDLQSWSVGQPMLDAYQEAAALAVISNTSVSPRSVLLSVRVTDASGVPIEQFNVLQDQTGGTQFIDVPSAAQVSVDTRWFTRNLPPGAYTLTAQVFDQAGTQLYAERSTTVTVRPTQRVADARLFVTPNYANQGATHELRVQFSSRNLSNVSTPMSLAYELIAPDGQAVQQGAGSWIFEPDTLSSTELVDAESRQLTVSGRYTLRVVSATGLETTDVAVNELSVAPNIRIDIDQHLDPSVIAPDGDRSIRMRLRIEGVEAAP